MQKTKYKKSLQLVKVLLLTSMLINNYVMASNSDIENDFEIVRSNSTTTAIASDNVSTHTAIVPYIVGNEINNDVEQIFPKSLTYSQAQILKSGPLTMSDNRIFVAEPAELAKFMMGGWRLISNSYWANALATRESENDNSATYKFANGDKFTIKLFNETLDMTNNVSALKASAINVATHAFSYGTKHLINTYLPKIGELHHAVESFAYTRGYSTVSHMMVDMAKQGRSYKLPARSELDDSKTQDVVENGQVGVQTINPELHEISEILGQFVSMITLGPELREAFTLHVQSENYPTVTHFIAGCKEFFEADSSEILRNRQLKLIENVTAELVKKFCPYGLGNWVVKGSHLVAKNTLDESSMTAYVLKNYILKQHHAIESAPDETLMLTDGKANESELFQNPAID